VSPPALIVLCGLPGAGKSRLARELSARAPVTVISADRVRRILVSQPAYSDQEHAFVHAVCHRLARRGLDEGRTVALDSTNLRQQHRQRFLGLADRYHVPCHVVHVECEEATIRSRLRRRMRGEGTDGSTADERVYELLRETVEPVREPCVRVRGDGDVTTAARTVLSLLRPEGVALPTYRSPAWARPTSAGI
jgi:predicted kinase